MKPKSTLRSFLCIASSALLTITYAQAATYTWSKVADVTTNLSTNWSPGLNWSAVPVSAADTTLVFGYTWPANTQSRTNTLTNDIASPFQLNVLTLGHTNPTAGSGSSIGLINIAGTPLEFVTNGGTTPQVNLNQNRSAGQVVSFDVQTNMVLTNNTLFTGNGTANFTVSGAISGAGSFTKSGTSALTLSGATFSAASLAMDGGTLTMSNAISSTTGALTMSAGTLTLSGANSYTGGSTINGGTLVFRNTGAQSASGTHVFLAGTTLGLGVGGAGFYDSAAITSAFGSGTILTNVTVTATTNVGIDTTGATAGTFTHSADITGSPTKGLTKLGANTLILSGNNTYTGATSIEAGTLSVATLANAGSSSTIGAYATPGAGGLLLQGGGTFNYTGATATTNRGFTLTGSGTINVNMAGATLTMGDVTSNGGSLTVTGGTGSSLALGTVTQNGALVFGSSTRATSIQSIILGATASTLSPFTGGLVTVGDITGTNQSYSIGGASGTITGNIALGTGNLSKAGTGTWTLTGLSSYSGTTTLAGNSTVNINTIKNVGAGNNSSLGAPTDSTKGTIAFNGGTLRYIGTGDSSDRVINLGGNVSLDMSGTGTLKFTSGLTSSNSDKTLTLTGSTAGIGELAGEIRNNSATNTTAVTKTGTGTWVLSGNSSGTNGYTDPTTVSGGRLHVTGSLKSAVTVANTATLSGTGSTTSTLALSAGSTIVGTTQGSSFSANTVTATSAVNIAGSNGIGTPGTYTIGVVRYATGAGPVTGNFSTTGYRSASVANNVVGAGGETRLTYTNEARKWDSTSGTWDAMATTPWQAGVSDSKYSQGDAVTFDDTGTGGSTRDVTLNSLVTPGSVTFNNSTSTYTVSGTGQIDGLTALTKSGTGTVTLSNANTYTGATAVNGGTLLINGSTHASSAVTVAAGSSTGIPVAKLGGTGTIGGTVSLTTESNTGYKNGGVLAPTAAPSGTALKVTGTTTFTTGSLFEWNMSATTPATDPGVVSNSGSYGQLAGTGAITGSNAVFNIVLGAGNAFTDNFWNSDKSWTNVFTGAGATNTLASIFASFGGAGVSTAGVVTGEGSFSFTGTNTLNWTYSAVPEPTSALAGLLLTAGLLRRRRNQGRSVLSLES